MDDGLGVKKKVSTQCNRKELLPEKNFPPAGDVGFLSSSVEMKTGADCVTAERCLDIYGPRRPRRNKKASPFVRAQRTRGHLARLRAQMKKKG